MTENYQDMTIKLVKIACILAILGFSFTSCELPDTEKVDTISNVFKQLSITSEVQLDSLVTGILSIEELENFNNPVKVAEVSLEDEMGAIRALMDVVIDEISNPDSLELNAENTLFLHSKNNVSKTSFTQKDSTVFKEGYLLKFADKVPKYDELLMLWKQVGNNYKPIFENDSITQEIKDRIQTAYPENIAVLEEIEYAVLIDDVLLIPPVIDYHEEGYSSGYVVSHVFIYDVKTFEKIGQMMVVSSNGDEISYRTKSDTISVNEDIINKKLREDLLKERNRVMDSIFDFNRLPH